MVLDGRTSAPGLSGRRRDAWLEQSAPPLGNHVMGKDIIRSAVVTALGEKCSNRMHPGRS